MKRKVLAGFLAATMILGTMSTAVFAETAETEAAPAAETEAAAEEDTSFSGMIGKILSNAEVKEALFGEEGAVNKLFGEEGALKDIVPEGTDIKGLLNDLGDQLSDENSDIYKSLNGIAGMVTNEDGSLNTDAIGEMAGSLFGGLFGSEEAAEAEGTEKAEGTEAAEYDGVDVDALAEAGMAYVAAQNDGLFEVGDVEIDIPYSIGYVMPDESTITSLGAYTQNSFTVDGDSLKTLAELSDAWLLTFKVAEDGTYTAEDGKKVDIEDEAALEEACETVEITTDDFVTAVAMTDEIATLSKFYEFLENHPEFTGIQLGEDMYSKEEIESSLETVVSDLLAALFGGIEEGAEEATGSIGEAVEEAAGAAEEAVAEVANAVEQAANEVGEAVAEAEASVAG